MDGNPKATLPKRFRSINHSDFRMMGSGQFTPSQLIKILNKLNAPVIIVDLRAESHGFINDIPVSWYGHRNWDNQNKSISRIEFEERDLLNQVSQTSKITLTPLRKEADKYSQTILKPLSVLSEAQLASKLGIGYQRFYVLDHAPPEQSELNKFIQFVHSIPKDTWLYFHCRGGQGRTTTFMVLYEILKAPNRSLNEIFADQVHAGGKDLKRMPPQSSYKYELAKERLAVIERFYESQITQKSINHQARK
ncbi:protein-tyrosine-phosphatase [Legionella impletisoli]|uniref:Protein-tyrosine-phosphatase n=2 Tax=Legionella impletisoli TaxID=343510 RepID=A0A917JTJ3_9GAMM|nr:protein-tyrosine-phosphatase [Legionella impletisoli]